VLNASRRVHESLVRNPTLAEEMAKSYKRLARWVIQDDVAIQYLREAFTSYVAAVRFME